MEEDSGYVLLGDIVIFFARALQEPNLQIPSPATSGKKFKPWQARACYAHSTRRSKWVEFLENKIEASVFVNNPVEAQRMLLEDWLGDSSHLVEAILGLASSQVSTSWADFNFQVFPVTVTDQLKFSTFAYTMNENEKNILFVTEKSGVTKLYHDSSVLDWYLLPNTSLCTEGVAQIECPFLHCSLPLRDLEIHLIVDLNLLRGVEYKPLLLLVFERDKFFSLYE